MRKIKPFGWLFGLLSALLVVMEPTMAEQPIRIGASMSLTGKAYSVQGGYGREGYLLCLPSCRVIKGTGVAGGVPQLL